MKNILSKAALLISIAVLVLVVASKNSTHGAIGTERAGVTALLALAR